MRLPLQLNGSAQSARRGRPFPWRSKPQPDQCIDPIWDSACPPPKSRRTAEVGYDTGTTPATGPPISPSIPKGKITFHTPRVNGLEAEPHDRTNLWS